MKNIVIFSVLLSSLLTAKVDFAYAPKQPEHRLPVNQSEVLSFRSILKEPIDAVVNISIKSFAKGGQRQFQDPFFEQFFGPQFRRQIPEEKLKRGLGSGVILSSDGYIVTNHHVIKGADEIVVNLRGDEREYTAKLIGTDKEGDLAVIKIDAKNLKPIKLGHASDVEVGDVVFAIGNPFGIGETVTQGIVSALNKHSMGINEYENFIQTDASINPGNSGGALIDNRGALIGINSAIISKSGGNNGIGLAIPIDMVKRVVESIIETGKPNRGFIGVRISKLTDRLKELYSNHKGAVIVDVDQSGAAFKAGMKRGDLIVKVGETTIDSPATLQRVIASIKPGSEVEVLVERDKKEVTLNLTPLSKDKQYSANSVLQGAKLATLNESMARQLRLPYGTMGVLVEEVEARSMAQSMGLQSGDVIIQVERTPIGTLEALNQALQHSKNRAKKIYINRRGATFLLVAK